MKCLVSEAREKCKCGWCEMNRKFREIHMKQVIEMESQRIYREVLKLRKERNNA